MGHRLTKIYTRTGDDGTTGLGDGSRVPKDGLRIAALGSVDELNSLIGRILCHAVPDDVRDCLDTIQHDLFEIGAEIAVPGLERMFDADIARLEELLERFNATLPPLKEFILPGGSMAAADAHIARTACRRAERDIVALGHHETARDPARRYLNRLSDILFVIARVLNRADGRSDVYWQQSRNRPAGE